MSKIAIPKKRIWAKLIIIQLGMLLAVAPVAWTLESCFAGNPRAGHPVSATSILEIGCLSEKIHCLGAHDELGTILTNALGPRLNNYKYTAITTAFVAGTFANSEEHLHSLSRARSPSACPGNISRLSFLSVFRI